LEFNVPFQHKYGYIRDERKSITVMNILYCQQLVMVALSWQYLWYDKKVCKL